MQVSDSLFKLIHETTVKILSIIRQTNISGAAWTIIEGISGIESIYGNKKYFSNHWMYLYLHKMEKTIFNL
jgi:hypothetical protein